MTTTGSGARTRLLEELFHPAIPELWCPILSHFSAKGSIDAERTRSHLESIAPYVGGILVPGSTGEGWAMPDGVRLSLLDLALDTVRTTRQFVLLGALKHSGEEMRSCILETATWVMKKAGTASWREAFRKFNIVAFTICPPRGAELGQDFLSDTLASILDLGYPIALYQLPQVTGNMLTPLTVRQLAAKYPNFLMFKDTSGIDDVASAEGGYEGVFMVRGAEGSYAKWPKNGGGPYDGFLLSAANGFSLELARMLAALRDGEAGAASRLSVRVEGVISETFALVKDFPHGNAFAVANKLIDHVRAWGARAAAVGAPLLVGGERLPGGWVSDTVGILGKHGFAVKAGYMENRLQGRDAG